MNCPYFNIKSFSGTFLPEYLTIDPHGMEYFYSLRKLFFLSKQLKLFFVSTKKYAK